MGQEDRLTGLVGFSGMKVPVRIATTAAITLSGEQTIDGVAAVTGDRVLVKDQASSVDNGIYVVDTGDWNRAADCDGPYDLVQGSVVYVNAGSTNTGFWYCTTANPITIDSSSIVWARASSVLAAVSAYIQTLLDDTTAADARTTLGAAASGANADITSLTGLTAGKTYTARSSDTVLGTTDYGRAFAATSTFTQTITAAATLGSGWWCSYRNNGTGIITLDPNSSETIDGNTTLKLYPGESCEIHCDGSSFTTTGLSTGWVYMMSGTASSSASLDFAGLTGFTDYKLIMENLLPATDVVSIGFRCSTNNGSSYDSSAIYYAGGERAYTTGVYDGSAGNTRLYMMSSIGNAGHGYSGELTVFNPASSSHKIFTELSAALLSDGNMWAHFGGGRYASGSVVNGINVAFSSGNIASGTVRVYGRKRT